MTWIKAEGADIKSNAHGDAVHVMAASTQPCYGARLVKAGVVYSETIGIEPEYRGVNIVVLHEDHPAEAWELHERLEPWPLSTRSTRDQENSFWDTEWQDQWERDQEADEWDQRLDGEWGD